MPPKLSSADVSNLDKWIESLIQCKPLAENEVKILCDKVIFYYLFFLFSQKYQEKN